MSRTLRGRMCFSAAGSFTLSGVLTAIGAVGLARSSRREHRLLAAVPLLFAAQQAAEGVVWVTSPPSDHTTLHQLATVAFLGAALVLWPSWVTLSVRLAERDAERGRVLTWLSILGVIVSLSSAILLLRSPPTAVIVGHSIRYHSTTIANHGVGVLMLIAYLVPTIGPFFASTLPMSRTIGVTLAVSLCLTLLIERDGVTSVWCFFAAILSLQTVLSLEKDRRAVANGQSDIGTTPPLNT